MKGRTDPALLHSSSFILPPSSLFTKLPAAPAAELGEVRVSEAAPAADALLLVDDLAAGDAREDDEQHERDDEDEDDQFDVVHGAEPFPDRCRMIARGVASRPL